MKRILIFGLVLLATVALIPKIEAVSASSINYKSADSASVKDLNGTTIPIIFLPAKEQANESVETLNRQIDEQIFCLARNIYWEARNQSKLGMIAVGRVVINRVNSDRYPSTICEVVHEGPTRESWKTRKDETLADKDRKFYPIRNRCQFSWYCDGASDKIVQGEEEIYQLSYSIARSIVLHNKWEGVVEGATHYHADYVNPTWGDKNKLKVKIDDHLFYKL